MNDAGLSTQLDKFDELWPRIDAVPGWLRPQEGRLLYDIARQVNGPIVELGAYQGRSTICIALAARFGFTTVDTFQGSKEHVANSLVPPYEGFKKNLIAFGLWDRTRVFVGDAAIAAQSFADKSVHFLFVDADHEYLAIARQLEAWIPKMVVGGVVALHDVGEWSGPTRAAADLLDLGFKHVTMQVGSLLALAVPENANLELQV